MSSSDMFEPEFWTITGAQPAISMLFKAPQRVRDIRPRQPTLMGLPRRKLSIWQMVAGMEAELMRAPRLIET